MNIEDHSHEVYTHMANIVDTIQKQKIVFYGHLTWMSPVSLIKWIFTYILCKKNYKGAGSQG